MPIDILDETITSAVIIGIIEAIKPIGINDRFLPLLSLILGVGIQIGWDGKIDAQTILQGVMSSLAAGGAYRGYRVVVQDK